MEQHQATDLIGEIEKDLKDLREKLEDADDKGRPTFFIAREIRKKQIELDKLKGDQ